MDDEYRDYCGICDERAVLVALTKAEQLFVEEALLEMGGASCPDCRQALIGILRPIYDSQGTGGASNL